MGCASCSTTKNGVPQGCGNKGHCTNGTCNKKNSFDWLATLDLHDPMAYKIVEVSFKNGNRKQFFYNPDYSDAITGDLVVVEAKNGYDVGRITLSGDLVRMQMKKKHESEENIIHKIVRKANFRDIEKLEEARNLEKNALVRGRAIARTIGVELKLGDVEYQGDKRKATFYYTAEGRIDFRELVRMYAKEFKVKIEMKQIGSRQESAIIGGIGTCGRELCCSTWKSDFQSVTTTAARYQNLAINQTKLTGQCGRLKCCLNYELDTYIDALGDFPEKADVLKLTNGIANLVKTDIFKGLMYYSTVIDNIRGPLIALTKEKVKKLQALNKKGIKIKDISREEFDQTPVKQIDIDSDLEFADVTGEIELPEIQKRRKKKYKKRKPKKPRSNQSGNNSGDTKNQKSGDKPNPRKGSSNRNKNRRNNTNRDKPKE
ncbi:MAG: hypothetical protein HKN09_14150 [Saprospiraceae bacterium]|nr:hypothetical protein [Saprospiraceae bacterium]